MFHVSCFICRIIFALRGLSRCVRSLLTLPLPSPATAAGYSTAGEGEGALALGIAEFGLDGSLGGGTRDSIVTTVRNRSNLSTRKKADNGKSARSSGPKTHALYGDPSGASGGPVSDNLVESHPRAYDYELAAGLVFGTFRGVYYFRFIGYFSISLYWWCIVPCGGVH